MSLRIHTSSLLVAVVAAAALAACSGDDSPAADDGTAEDTTTTAAPAAAVEAFTGSLDDFYVVPDPLPEGEPGELIRTMEVSSGEGTTTLRIMYHSRDSQDRDRAVTGTVTFPEGEAPDGGWPVISNAHGTTGVAPQCAPSRGDGAVHDHGIEGVHVATDYIGMGPVGELHPYLSRLVEGNSVIDAVRAARNLPEANAGERFLVIGGSQGGHAALAAAELAAERAPELELLGTVALAPGAMFEESYGPVDEVIVQVLTAMALYGGQGEYPGVELDDYFRPEALAVASDVMENGCLGDISTAMVAALPIFDVEPAATEPFGSLMVANDVGFVDSGAPLFLTSGTADTTVVLDRVEDLYERLCETGQVTELLIVEGATHGDIGVHTAEEITAWFQDRLDGAEPVDTCGEP